MRADPRLMLAAAVLAVLAGVLLALAVPVPVPPPPPAAEDLAPAEISSLLEEARRITREAGDDPR